MYMYVYVHASRHLAIHLSICPFVAVLISLSLSVSLSTSFSIYPSIHLSIYPATHLPIYLSSIYPFICILSSGRLVLQRLLQRRPKPQRQLLGWQPGSRWRVVLSLSLSPSLSLSLYKAVAAFSLGALIKSQRPAARNPSPVWRRAVYCLGLKSRTMPLLFRCRPHNPSVKPPFRPFLSPLLEAPPGGGRVKALKRPCGLWVMCYDCRTEKPDF